MKTYISLIGAAQEAVPVKTNHKHDALSILALALVGGVAGGVLWKKHRVLGALGGMSAGLGGYQLAKSEYKSAALTLIPTAVGITTSLKWKKHAAWGFILGDIAADIVVAAAERAIK